MWKLVRVNQLIIIDHSAATAILVAVLLWLGMMGEYKLKDQSCPSVFCGRIGTFDLGHCTIGWSGYLGEYLSVVRLNLSIYNSLSRTWKPEISEGSRGSLTIGRTIWQLKIPACVSTDFWSHCINSSTIRKCLFLSIHVAMHIAHQLSQKVCGVDLRSTLTCTLQSRSHDLK